MPQAIGAAVGPIFGLAAGSTGALALGQIITTILVNVALGSLEFRDEHGEQWIACDD